MYVIYNARCDPIESVIGSKMAGGPAKNSFSNFFYGAVVQYAGRPQGFNVDSVQIPYMIFFNPYISVHKTQYQIRTFRT